MITKHFKTIFILILVSNCFLEAFSQNTSKMTTKNLVKTNLSTIKNFLNFLHSLIEMNSRQESNQETNQVIQENAKLKSNESVIFVTNQSSITIQPTTENVFNIKLTTDVPSKPEQKLKGTDMISEIKTNVDLGQIKHQLSNKTKKNKLSKKLVKNQSIGSLETEKLVPFEVLSTMQKTRTSKDIKPSRERLCFRKVCCKYDAKGVCFDQ